MFDIAPDTVVAVTAFRNEAMNMRVPFEIPAKGMEDHDETRGEIHGFIQLMKHVGNDRGDSVKKAVKEGAVIEEEIPEIFINGKDTVPMDNIDQFKGHGGSAAHGI